MGTSPYDTVKIVNDRGDGFELFTSLNIINSVVRSSEGSFECGDSESWDTMSKFASIGKNFSMFVNDKLRVTGRVQILNNPISPDQSSVIRFVVRTKLADIEWASADPRVRVANTDGVGYPLQQVIESVLKSQGITSKDIVYRADLARDIMTGKKTKGGKAAKDLTPLKVAEAAVQPGETIKAFLDRHCRRHGLMFMDGPDGKIVFFEPDDDQDELFTFRCFRTDNTQYNNFNSAERINDITGVPSQLLSFGFGGGKDYRRSKVSGARINQELIDLDFRRLTIMQDDGIKTKEQADRTAAREMSERSRRQDCYMIECDGFSLPEDKSGTPFSPDTCATVLVETGGGSSGKYYLEEVQLSRNADSGDKARLQTVKAGTWAL